MDENNKYNEKPDENLIRKYYVAITRAKKSLFIYTNHNYFYNAFTQNNQNIYKTDTYIYKEPEEIIIELGLKDIHLGESFYYQEELKNAYLSNQPLSLKNDMLVYNSPVTRLSKEGIKKIGTKVNQGYKIKHIELVNLVYYYTENYKTNEKKEILQGIFNIILIKVD